MSRKIYGLRQSNKKPPEKVVVLFIDIVWSISRVPCFDEIDSPDFAKGYSAKGYIRIDEYLQEFVIQQRFGYYIHRPLSAYLNFVIAEGCTIRKIIEPTLTAEGIAALGNQDRNLRIPNFMVVSACKE